MTFREELEQVINRHSKESGSNTPDFILAELLADCLEAFDQAHTLSSKDRYLEKCSEAYDKAVEARAIYYADDDQE